MVRTRFVGNRPFVEVKLGTGRGTSLESAHQLSEVVEKELSASNWEMPRRLFMSNPLPPPMNPGRQEFVRLRIASVYECTT